MCDDVTAQSLEYDLKANKVKRVDEFLYLFFRGKSLTLNMFEVYNTLNHNLMIKETIYV